RTLDALEARGLTLRREGAVWLRGAAVGLTQDRVLVKSSGEPAYRLPDIAYHLDKLARGFDAVIDVLGADHIAEHQEVAAALRALGVDAARVRAVIYQFVTLTRHGEQVKMSTRRAEYVTLDELLDEVGVDAARFFFLMRKSDSHLEFDLDLAKQQSTDNPVFYVQYAHARIASVLRQAAEGGIALVPAPDLSPLGEPEVEVVRAVASWPDVAETAARDLEPHRIVFHARDLAAAFHRYYNLHRILTEHRASTHARARGEAPEDAARVRLLRQAHGRAGRGAPAGQGARGGEAGPGGARAGARGGGSDARAGAGVEVVAAGAAGRRRGQAAAAAVPPDGGRSREAAAGPGARRFIRVAAQR